MNYTERNCSDSYLKSLKFYTDPETRCEVFRKHWLNTVKIMSKDYLTLDESEPAIYYMEQMVCLVIEENSSESLTNNDGPIFKYSIQEDIFNKIYDWSVKFSGDVLEKLKRQQLRLFATIVGQCHPSVLHRRPLLSPLLRLLNGYSIRSSHQLEISLVHLLKLMCIRVSNEPILQGLCAEIGQTALRDPVPLLNPLIPFLHRDGDLGREARDAVLLLLTLSVTNEDVACSVALQSDFCPVLATTLSALNSNLPRKLPEYCHMVLLGQLNAPFIRTCPELQHFLDYLHFCCQVNQVSHPLIREAVMHYIYNGFLIPVIGPSLNRNSLDQVVSATMYVELFIRSITDPGILKAFLCFITGENHEGQRILHSLINRMKSSSGLGVATLSLIHTLLSLNCEDVMFELVFRHLIPCRHLPKKHRNSISSRNSIFEASTLFHSLRPNFFSLDDDNGTDLLEFARTSIEKCHKVCESTWQFDYNGINPSPDYMEKTLDTIIMQTQKPFHGFLDHYTQLLEMRDICRKNSQVETICTPRSTRTVSSSNFDFSESFNFTPSSQLSRSNSVDTLTSMKFDTDSQLDQCLYKLRYPSAEDILEQKSRYMISYNVMDFVANENDEISSVKSGSTEQSVRINDNHIRNGDVNHYNDWESLPDSGISMDELDKIAHSDQLEDFTSSLESIEVSPKMLRSCTFSLEEVLKIIADNHQVKNEEVVNHLRPSSPAASIMSLQSVITIEDNMLRGNPDTALKMVSNHYGSVKQAKASVGHFLEIFLLLLEQMDTNPFNINLILSNILLDLMSYPQPLLRNYLFDVCQPLADGVRSLYFVFQTVQIKLDEVKTKMNISRSDDKYFQSLCTDGLSKLMKRLDLLESENYQLEEQLVMCGYYSQNVVIDPSFGLFVKSSPKKSFNLFQFLSRKPQHSEPNNWFPMKKLNNKEYEYSSNLNTALAAIIFDELCKEVSAFSTEHSVFVRPKSFQNISL